jgi:hypothetical protein
MLKRIRRGGAYLAVIATLVSFCAVPAAAFASPTDDIYGGVAGRVESNQTGSTADPKGQGLPFTGLSVGIVVVAGACLIGTGLVVRRASRDT